MFSVLAADARSWLCSEASQTEVAMESALLVAVSRYQFVEPWSLRYVPVPAIADHGLVERDVVGDNIVIG